MPAQTYQWIGGSGDWDILANWLNVTTPGSPFPATSIPTPSDNVILAGPAGTISNIGTAHALVVTGPQSLSGSLGLGSSGFIFGPTNTGLELTNGAVLNAAGPVGVGGYGSNGTLVVDAGGSLNAANALSLGETGTISFDGSSSSGSGIGFATIAAGAVVTVGTSSLTPIPVSMVIGDSVGSAGSVTMSGTLTLTQAPPFGDAGLYVGHSGNGVLNVTGTGALLNSLNNEIQLGAQSGSTGTLLVENGGSLIVSSGESISGGTTLDGAAIQVGPNGTGSLDVTGGTLTASGEIQIGLVNGSGTVTVGAGAVVQQSDPTGVAASGIVLNDGSLLVSGGLVTADALAIGSASSPVRASASLSGGTVSLTGTSGLSITDAALSMTGGSLVSPTAGVTVGGAGSASFNGGSITIKTLTVSLGSVSIGAITANIGTIQQEGSLSLNNTTLAGISSFGILFGQLSGSGSIGTSIGNNGTITALGNLSIAGSVTNSALSGAVGLGAPGTLTVQGGLHVGAITFSGANEVLNAQSLGTYTTLGSGGFVTLATTITGFTLGDSIGILGATETIVANTGTVLTLGNVGGGGGTTLTFAAAPATGQHFVVTNAAGNTNVSLQVACFRAGTAIATPSGDIRVDDLRIGDLVLTHTGDPRPITWIGTRDIDCARHPRPEQVQPIRIAPGAFGPGLPRRTLYLSPDHAIFDTEARVLIPIRHLLNGTTIARLAAPRVTYFHIELPEHAVILAERLPAESYLDIGDRAGFANAGGPTTLHPTWGATDRTAHLWEASGAAPLCLAGPPITRLRAHLARRAEARQTAPAVAMSQHGHHQE